MLSFGLPPGDEFLILFLSLNVGNFIVYFFHHAIFRRDLNLPELVVVVLDVHLFQNELQYLIHLRY